MEAGDDLAEAAEVAAEGDAFTAGRRLGQIRAKEAAALRHAYWEAVAKVAKRDYPTYTDWEIVLHVIAQAKMNRSRYAIGGHRHGAPRTVYDYLKRRGIVGQD